jgi:hypothetical protein
MRVCSCPDGEKALIQSCDGLSVSSNVVSPSAARDGQKDWNGVGDPNPAEVEGVPQMYSQNSFNPARLKQSTPSTTAVAPAKEVEAISPYGLVCLLKDKA